MLSTNSTLLNYLFYIYRGGYQWRSSVWLCQNPGHLDEAEQACSLSPGPTRCKFIHEGRHHQEGRDHAACLQMCKRFHITREIPFAHGSIHSRFGNKSYILMLMKTLFKLPNSSIYKHVILFSVVIENIRIGHWNFNFFLNITLLYCLKTLKMDLKLLIKNI